MSIIRHHIFALAAAAVLTIGTAAPAWAQNISEIANSDPLVITGAVGTQNTYRYSSTGHTMGSPLSNSVYANLNISLYGFSMPFSLYYSNDNLGFSYPQLSLNLTPQYKNWTGHIGQSSMTMSNYVMNTSFNGIGLEYNDHRRWRGGIFYGVLRKAINDDPTDPFARKPQYKRVGWGLKMGYGTNRNYIDLFLLRAYDRPNTLDEQWRRYISPQENIVVGLKGVTSPVKWMSFSANAAASVYTADTDASKIQHAAAEAAAEAGINESEVATEVTGSDPGWYKVFTPRYTTLARFAGDANLNLHLRGVNASISYRMIQPDFNSLGLRYMANNYHSLGVSLNTVLFRRLSLSGFFNGQEDNLTNRQMYTTRGFVYNAMASTRIGSHFNISAAYNGYTQNQGNGTAIVNDTTKLDRRMGSYSLTPSLNFEDKIFGHTIAVTANYTQNLDRNMMVRHRNDINTLAIGASYNIDVKPWETAITATYSHQQTKGYRSKYVSDVGAIDVGRSFLSERNLHVSAGVNLCYNHIWLQSKSMSIGGQCSASYTLKKNHVFSASASFSKFGDVNMTTTRSNLDDTNITASLNYVYTFNLWTIKSKKHKKEDQEKQNKI